MTPAKKPTTAQADVGEKKKEYKYQQEISQMVGSPVRSMMATRLTALFTDVRFW
jgi:hypothetical protein